jgi:hypothetical protein
MMDAHLAHGHGHLWRWGNLVLAVKLRDELVVRALALRVAASSDLLICTYNGTGTSCG